MNDLVIITEPLVGHWPPIDKADPNSFGNYYQMIGWLRQFPKRFPLITIETVSARLTLTNTLKKRSFAPNKSFFWVNSGGKCSTEFLCKPFYQYRLNSSKSRPHSNKFIFTTKILNNSFQNVFEILNENNFSLSDNVLPQPFRKLLLNARLTQTIPETISAHNYWNSFRSVDSHEFSWKTFNRRW